MTDNAMMRDMRAEPTAAPTRLARAMRPLLAGLRAVTRLRRRRHDPGRLSAHVLRDIGISRERK